MKCNRTDLSLAFIFENTHSVLCVKEYNVKYSKFSQILCDSREKTLFTLRYKKPHYKNTKRTKLCFRCQEKECAVLKYYVSINQMNNERHYFECQGSLVAALKLPLF